MHLAPVLELMDKNGMQKMPLPSLFFSCFRGSSEASCDCLIRCSGIFFHASYSSVTSESPWILRGSNGALSDGALDISTLEASLSIAELI